ncbi:MAG: hypothetical protein NC191_09710 [Muribaculaceae bacterium]|nr:hypothetical protein [Muribaculaceae bacterium]
MNNYKFDSIVSRNEQDALRDMIFKRARERAEALNENIQSSYTSDIRNDVMDLARDSFVSEHNPFSQRVAEPVEEQKAPEVEIGFSKKHVETLKAQIEYKNKTTREDIVHKETEDNMKEARADFSNKKTFMGALDFLNSQASIALVKNKGRSFEAIA